MTLKAISIISCLLLCSSSYCLDFATWSKFSDTSQATYLIGYLDGLNEGVSWGCAYIVPMKKIEIDEKDERAALNMTKETIFPLGLGKIGQIRDSVNQYYKEAIEIH